MSAAGEGDRADTQLAHADPGAARATPGAVQADRITLTRHRAPTSPAGVGEVRRVLVLKLGAFGNMVLSFGSFAAIRHHHAGATLTLLTTAPFAAWMAESPWFDRVLIDPRPAWWDVRGVLRLRAMLTDSRPDRVYDLQTSSRSGHYFRLFPRAFRPQWSGVAAGASHPDRATNRGAVHDIARQQGQLRQAGIDDFPPPDLSWCRGDIARFGLPSRFALLVPGSSAHRPAKRWPAGHYRALAAWLTAQGIAPVIVGSADETPLAQTIAAEIPARDLTGQTEFGDIADLARAACAAVGNDTGPMHLIAAAGCTSLVLFSRDSDPALCAPWPPGTGAPVRVLRRDALADLPPADVTDALAALLRAIPAPPEARDR